MSAIDLNYLINAIQRTNQYFLRQVQKQVNTSLTLRNWVIGHHLVEYEQRGKDRAAYGEKLYDMLALRLGESGIKGSSPSTLRLCRQFYSTYPQILQTVSGELQ